MKKRNILLSVALASACLFGLASCSNDVPVVSSSTDTSVQTSVPTPTQSSTNGHVRYLEAWDPTSLLQ